MKEQLIQYVELLFAGVPGSEEIKQEILQNTLDRYDDLIAEGKVPQAAYRMAITGIGDINEILGTGTSGTSPSPAAAKPEADTEEKKRKRAIAIVLYILCPIPILVLGSVNNDFINVLGVCGLFILVALASYLWITNSTKEEDAPEKAEPELLKSIKGAVSALGLVIYFILSFYTQAWYITWVIFPLIGAVNGLIAAIYDLKEANKQ